jgi:hypothetical protein
MTARTLRVGIDEYDTLSSTLHEQRRGPSSCAAAPPGR